MSRPLTAHPHLLALVLVAATACDRDVASAPLGRVSVALSADVCADYCLAAMRASLFAEGDDVLPIGPALQVGCGETLTFAALPAGERVHVVLQAFDITGELLLDGTSEAITIIADGVAEARVKLVARSAPEVESYGPEPLVVAGGAAELTVTGRFGAALGRAGVHIGADFYDPDALAWTRSDAGDVMIRVSVPKDARGGELVVEQCGVGSEPLALRVIGSALGEAAASAVVTCAGANARAASASDDVVLVAWGCADGSGVLTSLRLDDALCPLDPGASWPLASIPDALAVLGDSAWVGGAGGLSRIDMTAPGGTPITVGNQRVHALAASASEVVALVTDVDDAATHLARVSDAGLDAVAGVDSGLALVALSASAERVFVAAHTATGEGRLLVVPSAGQGSVASISLVDGDARCDAPTALALSRDGARVVLGCAAATPADGVVAVWRTDLQRMTLVPSVGALEALAFDDTADVFFAAAIGGTALSVIELDDDGSGRVLHRFEHPARPGDRPALLVGLAEHRLLMPSATAPLAVLTPFDGLGPCAVAP